ncbi:hypothetical protein FHS83_001769 [Rhizomicrobium palustre]|uniref:DUF2934 domain-containing protein n=1 Tax=Rhizomicrobium palustre TaxID=189966 RepID=A0A846MZC6_9PROT|nr:DUF2934 domain-containing protein [Rhizomicrobium palustre]NIK88451.1 hypothetical protein [Rhizomicrobium palustre]
MPTTPIVTDDEIRTRSYLLWESEGCQHGKDAEYWLRAKEELEREAAAKVQEASMASMGGESTDFVLPVLPISTPPAKSVSDKLAHDDADLKKVV